MNVRQKLAILVYLKKNKAAKDRKAPIYIRITSFVMSEPPFLSFGKIRDSYGVTGNDQIGDYQYSSSYTPTGFT